MKPSSQDDYRNRERTIVLLTPKRLGARIEWYGQQMRTPVKRRDAEQAKGAERLGPKWAWSWDRRCVLSCREHQSSRRKGLDLTHSDIGTEHGKPISLPQGKATRKGSRWSCGYKNVEKAKAAL